VLGRCCSCCARALAWKVAESPYNSLGGAHKAQDLLAARASSLDARRLNFLQRGYVDLVKEPVLRITRLTQYPCAQLIATVAAATHVGHGRGAWPAPWPVFRDNDAVATS
jgi:hypothetical protein